MEKLCRAFPAVMEEYDAMLDFVVAQAKACGVPQKKLMKLQLGFEEAVVNVIHYAYDAGTQGNLWIRVWQEPGRFFLELSNGGKCFNPLERKNPEKASGVSIEDVAIGGWGIYFIRRSFDELSYRTDLIDGKPGNFLTMVLHL